MKQQHNQHKVYIVGGPTASGKTSLALDLAKKDGGELVNADSMQVYQSMNIGTNKGLLKESQVIKPIELQALDQNFSIIPFEVENSGIIGWMFDIVQPDFNFTVAHYQRIALEVIKQIANRGQIPIVVGGTGLYIDALLNGYSLVNGSSTAQRAELDKLSVQELQERLAKSGFDLSTLNNSDLNNPRRLIRYIEKQGDKNSSKQNDSKLADLYDVTFYYPKYDREKLTQKIETRAKWMVENGLIDEVRTLLARGYDEKLKSMQSTGYKQVSEYLKGEIKTEEELIEKIALAHKQYAKRQITWFEGQGREYDLHFV